jgi:hypothetical protein
MTGQHRAEDGTPGRHRLKETPEAGGGQHRANGEAAEPITEKRRPGRSMAKPLVNDSAARKYAARTRGIR